MSRRQPRQTIVRTADTLFRTMFERTAELPLTWRLMAESLLRAARALVPLIEADWRASQDPDQEEFEHPVAEVYMLLAGLAIENLAKAMLVEGSPTPVTKKGVLVRRLLSHDLVKLFDQTGLTFTADEIDLAERLQVFVQWAGRYPLPVRVDDQLPRMQRTGGSAPPNYITSSDFDDINALAAKLSLGKQS
jgi:hypothetical protein